MKKRKLKNSEFRTLERGLKEIAKKAGTRKCISKYCLADHFAAICHKKGYELEARFAGNCCNVCYACKNSKYHTWRDKYLWCRNKPCRRENWNMRP